MAGECKEKRDGSNPAIDDEASQNTNISRSHHHM